MNKENRQQVFIERYEVRLNKNIGQYLTRKFYNSLKFNDIIELDLTRITRKYKRYDGKRTT